MNEDKLKELEEHYRYLSTGDAKAVFDLIKYVRQLEKEAKEDECPYCNIIAIQSKTIGELLLALKPFAQARITIEAGFDAGADFVMDETKVFNVQSPEINTAYKVHTKHSTEGGK